jgi:hypothetical protein
VVGVEPDRMRRHVPTTLQEAKPEAGSIPRLVAVGCGSQTGAKPRSRTSRRKKKSPADPASTKRRSVSPTKINRVGRAANETTRGPGTPEMARHPSAGANLRGAQKNPGALPGEKRKEGRRRSREERVKNRPARPRMSVSRSGTPRRMRRVGA